MKLAAVVIGLALATSACDKAGDSAGGKSSGSASTDESSLMSYLPASANALFGGNYMKFQKYLQSSPLGKIYATLDKQAPGLQAFTDCWLEMKNITMLGAVNIEAGAMRMQFVTKGADLAALEGCTKKANFPSTMDPDKKFLSIEMPSAMGPMKSGYLVLPNGALYSRMAMPIGGKPEPTNRAMLEADIAAVAGKSIDKNTTLMAAMQKVDRTRPMWFVGTGANTSISDKLGLAYGTFDIANGLALDVSAQVLDKSIADKAMEGVTQMKQQAGSMGGTMGEVVKSLQVTRTGDTIRAAVSISNKQLEDLMKQLAPMMGALGGAR